MSPIVGERGWNDLTALMGWLCEHWDQPDEGIWETRGGRQPFMYGRLQSWVAFDRAIKMASERSRPADIGRWIRVGPAIRHSPRPSGWNPKLADVRPIRGPASASTHRRCSCRPSPSSPERREVAINHGGDGKTLVTDSWSTARPQASLAALPGSEGIFSLCTGWYIDALTRSGRLDEARLAFEKMLTYGNHLGLFSEEISSTGEQLGNFPQAFTHLSLINAAINLNHQLNLRAAPVAA